MAAYADVVIVCAWAVVLGQNALLVARGVGQPASRVRWAIGVVLVAALVAAGATLERASGGRFDAPGALTFLGVSLAVAGAALHVRARSVLGSAWSPTAVPSANVLVERGPYAVVRHPLYLALGMVGVGTAVAHPSLPTFAGAVGLTAGLALKIAREEEVLAGALGPRWIAYSTRVPCVIPRAFGRD